MDIKSMITLQENEILELRGDLLNMTTEEIVQDANQILTDLDIIQDTLTGGFHKTSHVLECMLRIVRARRNCQIIKRECIAIDEAIGA